MEESAKAAIEDHAVIGDGRSIALVSRDGTIDWLCWPRFDSPSLFASLLDPIRGGSFEMKAPEAQSEGRRYVPDTNVLQTLFHTASGDVRLTDLMSLESAYRGSLAPENEVLREARCTGGSARVKVRVDPRPDYGARRPRIERAGPSIWRIHLAGGRALLLQGMLVEGRDRRGEPDELFQPEPEGGLAADCRLLEGDRLIVSLVFAESNPAVMAPVRGGVDGRIARTIAWWQDWSSRRRYQGPYFNEVMRSALALKLLAFAPSGAVVAAATTSLPEKPKGDLNWDYRFCWLRDASMTVHALYGLGCPGEARSFISWLLHATRMHLPRVRVLYDVYGRLPPAERELNWLSGWGGAKPVRTGNAAVNQLQLDVFGEVIDAVVRFVEAESAALDGPTRRMLRSMGEWVCRNWELPDAGIWEQRDVLKPHTHSKVMCWVALDGLLRLYDKGVLTKIPVERFRMNRELLRETIETRGFDASLGAYTASLDEAELDAALLRLPSLGFVPAHASRMRSTVRLLRERLGVGRGSIYRYGRSLDDEEGAFVVCGFWLADALARGAGSLA
ncbi:MAG: glycoside hydrolase family 15 protein, partial [Myxococcota bacterium]